ncbi:MAG TPA: PorV/PorQ family protein [candidate division Zixibacteria bacterium]|nr:PorV/PorQ family protein [candidate division Zixibacteria bacterium]
MTATNRRTRTHRTLAAFCIALGALAFVAEQASAVSSAAALYLRLAAGARPAGMGEAYVAVADDATATHWNPAGLGAAPLSAVWHDVTVPPELRPLRQLATIKRGSSVDGLDGYEFWAISEPKGLVVCRNGEWKHAREYETAPDENIEAIVRRFLKTSDEALVQSALARVAEVNNAGTVADIERFEEKVMAALPAEGQMRGEISNYFLTLKKNYNALLVNWERFDQARRQFTQDNEDNALSEQELDRLSVGIERSLRRYLPEVVLLPFDMALSGELTSLVALDRNVWVGTTNGLHSFNGRSWVSYYAAGEGSQSGSSNVLPSNNITMLAVDGKRLLVGTDRGLIEHFGLGWDPVGVASGLPQGSVSAVTYSSSAEAWAVVDGEIYHLTAGVWMNYTDYTVALDDTPEIIAKNFAIYGTNSEREKYLEKFNNLNEGAGMNLGDKIHVPFIAEIKGEITTLHYSENALWVGTAEGLLLFDGKGWHRPGYREYTSETAISVTDLALEAANGDSAVALMVAQRIREQNDLSGEMVQPGQTVWVYRNIAASRINDIRTVDGAVHIATASGAMVFDNGRFSRYNQSGMGHGQTIAVNESDGSVWYASSERISFNRAPNNHIFLQHAKWLPELADDLSYNFFSVVHNFSSVGTFGFSISYFDYGEIPRTDENGNPLGSETPADYAIALSYGLPLNSKTSIGATVKFLRSDLSEQGAGLEFGEGKATGFAFDFGALHRVNSRLSLGAAMTNLGPDLSYIDAQQSDPLPLNLALGVAFTPVSTDLIDFLVVVDGNSVLVEDKLEPIFNGGVELTYADFISVRMGRIHDDAGDIKAWTFGAGLRLNVPGIGTMPIDLSYIPSSEDLALSNTVRPSLSIVF